MKKIAVFALTLVLTSTTLIAQDNTTDFRTRFLVGIKAGANLSNVYDAKGENLVANSKMGFAGGMFVAIPLGKYFGLQPEVMYSQKGFKATGNMTDGSYNLTRTSNFIDLPVFFSFKPSEFITLLAGPQLSYLMSQKNEFKNGSTTNAQEQAFDDQDVRKNTLCAVLGVDLTMKHFVIGVRAGWDVQSNVGSGSETTPQYKNMWYQATLGYRFYSK